MPMQILTQRYCDFVTGASNKASINASVIWQSTVHNDTVYTIYILLKYDDLFQQTGNNDQAN